MDYRQSLAYAIKFIAKVMKADFGMLYAKQFPTEEDFVIWKKRMWQKLKGLHPQDILDGYDYLLGQKPNHLPGIPEIVAATLHCQKQRLKSEREVAETNRLAALPPSQEIPDDMAKQNLVKIRALLAEAFNRNHLNDTEEKRQEQLAAHDELLKRDFPMYGKVVMDTTHKCAVGWCGNPGVLTNATSGAEHWYCNEHFKKSS